jgi:hypothetical protein
MFGLFGRSKKKAESELLVDLMRAAGEGALRSRLREALSTLGITLPTKRDDTELAIFAVSELVKKIVIHSNCDENLEDNDERFVVGIFCVVASNYISRVYAVSFEIVGAVSPINVVPLGAEDEIPSYINSYNLMSQQGRVIEAIGTSIAKWVNEPSDDKFSSLVKLFDLLLEHARK